MSLRSLKLAQPVQILGVTDFTDDSEIEKPTSLHLIAEIGFHHHSWITRRVRDFYEFRLRIPG
jgi:hypothetical protein